MLSLEVLHSSYEMTAIKPKQTREKLESHIQCNSHFKMEDSVLSRGRERCIEEKCQDIIT